MSLQSNIDQKMDRAAYDEAEKDEKNTHIVEKHIAESKGYAHMGELVGGRGAQTVTTEHLQNDAGDIRQRRSSGEKVIPVWHFTDEVGETRWVLNDADTEACEQGYICECCLEWQKSPIDLMCKSIHGRTCGYRKGL